MAIGRISPQFRGVELPSPEPLTYLMAGVTTRASRAGTSSKKMPEEKDGVKYPENLTPADARFYNYSSAMMDINKRNFQHELAAEAMASGNYDEYLLRGAGRDKISKFYEQKSMRNAELQSILPAMQEHGKNVFTEMRGLSERGVKWDQYYYSDEGNRVYKDINTGEYVEDFSGAPVRPCGDLRPATVGDVMGQLLSTSSVSGDVGTGFEVSPQGSIVVEDVDTFYDQLNESLARAAEDINLITIEDTSVKPLGGIGIGGKITEKTTTTGTETSIGNLNQRQIDAALSQFMDEVNHDAVLKKTYNVLFKTWGKAFADREEYKDLSEEDRSQKFQEFIAGKTTGTKLKSHYKYYSNTTEDYVGVTESGSKDGKDPNFWAMIAGNDPLFSEMKKTERIEGTGDRIESTYLNSGTGFLPEDIDVMNFVSNISGDQPVNTLSGKTLVEKLKNEYTVTDELEKEILSDYNDYYQEGERVDGLDISDYEKGIINDRLDRAIKEKISYKMLSAFAKDLFMRNHGEVFHHKNLRYNQSTEEYDVVMNGDPVMSKDGGNLSYTKEEIVPGASFMWSQDAELTNLQSLRLYLTNKVIDVPKHDDDAWTVDNPYFMTGQSIGLAIDYDYYDIQPRFAQTSSLYQTPLSQVGHAFISGEWIDITGIGEDETMKPIIYQINKVYPFMKGPDGKYPPVAEVKVMMPDKKSYKEQFKFWINTVKDGKLVKKEKNLKKDEEYLNVEEGYFSDYNIQSADYKFFPGYTETKNQAVIVVTLKVPYEGLILDASNKTTQTDTERGSVMNYFGLNGETKAQKNRATTD